jgi:hypothetical protein
MRYNNDPMNEDVKTEGQTAAEPAPVGTAPEAVEAKPEEAQPAEEAKDETPEGEPSAE